MAESEKLSHEIWGSVMSGTQAREAARAALLANIGRPGRIYEPCYSE
jgi:hypothetical protein